jgi:hypothetical protein
MKLSPLNDMDDDLKMGKCRGSLCKGKMGCRILSPCRGLSPTSPYRKNGLRQDGESKQATCDRAAHREEKYEVGYSLRINVGEKPQHDTPTTGLWTYYNGFSQA